MPEFARLLVDAGADIHNKHKRSGWQIIHHAVLCQNEPLLRLLVERGADINSKTFQDVTPYSLAKRFCFSKEAAYLASINP